MEPEDYIQNRLSALGKENQAEKIDSEKELVDFIYKSIMSKKFRKYSVNLEYQKEIYSAIELNVKNSQPIKITLVFGGYKLWRLDESPEVDWAELFSMIYYANWIKPVADNYKPGVWFDFYSDDIILRTINNIPEKDTEDYCESFQKLLIFLKSYIPKNITMTLNRVGKQYKTYNDFQTELNTKIDELRKQNLGLPNLTPEQISTIELNVKLKPGQDKNPQWREKIALIHDSYMIISKRRPYYRTPDKIVAITRPVKNTIAVGTTKSSVVKFWVGVGALKKQDQSWIETILSPEQLKNTKFSWQETNIKNLNLKNFHKIRIIEN